MIYLLLERDSLHLRAVGANKHDWSSFKAEEWGVEHGGLLLNSPSTIVRSRDEMMRKTFAGWGIEMRS
jgi:hypothetical protein